MPTEESDLILETITQSLDEPKKFASDAGSYENPDISELIAAHKYVSGLDPEIAANPFKALRYVKLRPPGAV